MSHNWNDRTLALAGIFQAAALVKQLATTGHIPNKNLETAINSLFEQNPNTIEDVYGSTHALELGLKHLNTVIRRKNSNENNDIVRYVMGIIHLQKKLMKHPKMLETVGTRLQQSEKQAEHFGITHENVIANLADIYMETLSTFSFRIQVAGDYNYLQQKRIGHQIRTLLFAGIRAAVLWRQLGGNRLQVIIHRKAMINSSQQLLDQIKSFIH